MKENIILIDARRENYSVKDCSTLTIKEFIDLLSDYGDNMKIYLSYDGGYTYGGIKKSRIHEETIDYTEEGDF